MTHSGAIATAADARVAGREARVERRLSASPFLAAPLRALGYDSREVWAWDMYEAAVLAFAAYCRQAARHEDGLVRLLEIGGGRRPLLSPEQARAAGIAYTVNDISSRELAFGPPEFARAEFDVAGAVDPALYGRHDLIISRMVMEHVRDASRAWANMAALLAPGGVALAFHPTLYAPPFMINRLIPETLTAPVLKYFFADRHDGDFPKFPARYDLCRADPAVVEPALRRAGFGEVLTAPFWGDRYFRHLPGIREAGDALSSLAEQRDWRLLASYAYTIGRM
jgi:SAM-dependent methyltransferase